MGAVTLARVLADIAAGLVTANQHDYIAIPDAIPADQGETYRLLVVDCQTRSWVMRPAQNTTPGWLPLILTTLGGYAARELNSDGYVSRGRFGLLDSKAGVQAVTR